MNNQTKLEQTFISESNDILSELENDLIMLEKVINTNTEIEINPEINKRILRNLHTLKGSSGLIEDQFLPGFIHFVESAVKNCFDNSMFTKKNIGFFLTTFDYIKYLVDTLISKKGSIDVNKYNENIKELSSFSESKNSYKQEGPRFAIFTDQIEESPLKKGVYSLVDTNKTSEEKLYYLKIKLNEKRIGNTWIPEDIIDDVYKAGKVVFIKGIPFQDISWNNYDISQCFYEWTVILKTKNEYEKIAEIFMFFIGKNQIEIKLIDEEIITETIKKLIDNNIDDKIIENILSEWEELLLNSTIYTNSIDNPNNNVNNITIEKTPERRKTQRNNSLEISDELKISNSKVNKLINLIGELIIANSGLDNIKLKIENPELEKIQENINNISKQLRDLSLSMKMVPIGQLLTKFHRMVRDLSGEFGKDIELFIEGENTEVDKSLFGVLEESLLHIIRNSIDHGIEMPEERLRKKKDKSGKIFIKAFHENEQLVVEVSDDGKGLDRDKILKKGIEKNILTSSEKYTDEDIYKVIFESNFSTSDNINLISGRGIGMDIVRSELLKANGSIKIKSKQNEGTTFIINLPLTLAIIEGFLIRIGINYFVIPLNFVLECIEINLNKLIDKKMTYNFRKKLLNVIMINDILKNINYDKNEDDLNKSIVVIDYQDELLGILADEILGNIQVVVKIISKQINENKILLGSTLLGNGEVALILDIRNILTKL